MIRNIVFDMGRVLLSYEPMLPCLRCTGNVADAKLVCDAIFNHPQWAEKIDGGLITDEEYLKLAQSRLETPALKEAAARVMENWELDALWPKEGMSALVDELLASGYALYVLSNTGLRFHDFEYKIPRIGEFGGRLLSAEEHLLKPSPAIYERFCEKFGVLAEECFFIDDVMANIEGAKTIGMNAYCFADGDVARLREFIRLMK